MEFNKLNFKVNLVFIVTLFVNVFSFAQITVSTLAGSNRGNTDGTVVQHNLEGYTTLQQMHQVICM